MDAYITKSTRIYIKSTLTNEVAEAPNFHSLEDSKWHAMDDPQLRTQKHVDGPYARAPHDTARRKTCVSAAATEAHHQSHMWCVHTLHA